MKMKKLMSAALAGVMALSMGATALASGTTVTDLSEGAELELTSVTKGATIRIAVPTSLTIGLNPYEMNVKLDNGKLVDDTAAGAQVISPIYKLENQSTLPIDVAISVAATAEGVTLLTSGTTIPSTDTSKSAIVQMKYIAGQPSATELTALPGGTATTITLDAENTVAGSKTATMAVPNDTTPTSSNLYFTFEGKLNKKAATAWTSEDIVGATIAFTFTLNTK